MNDRDTFLSPLSTEEGFRVNSMADHSFFKHVLAGGHGGRGEDELRCPQRFKAVMSTGLVLTPPIQTPVSQPGVRRPECEP